MTKLDTKRTRHMAAAKSGRQRMHDIAAADDPGLAAYMSKNDPDYWSDMAEFADASKFIDAVAKSADTHASDEADRAAARSAAAAARRDKAADTAAARTAKSAKAAADADRISESDAASARAVAAGKRSAGSRLALTAARRAAKSAARRAAKSRRIAGSRKAAAAARISESTNATSEADRISKSGPGFAAAVAAGAKSVTSGVVARRADAFARHTAKAGAGSGPRAVAISAAAAAFYDMSKSEADRISKSGPDAARAVAAGAKSVISAAAAAKAGARAASAVDFESRSGAAAEAARISESDAAAVYDTAKSEADRMSGSGPEAARAVAAGAEAVRAAAAAEKAEECFVRATESATRAAAWSEARSAAVTDVSAVRTDVRGLERLHLPTKADPYFEMIESLREHGNPVFEGKPFLLPGQGMSYDHCGQFGYKSCFDATERDAAHPDVFRAKSEAHRSGEPDASGKAFRFPFCCGGLGCPVCLRPTCAKMAAKLTERIMAYYIQRYGGIWDGSGKGRPLRHDMISAPPDWKIETPEDMSRVINRLHRWARRVGMEGGASIIHAYRFGKGLKNPRWSVHLHMIGCGWLERNGDKVIRMHKRTGITYKHISHINTRGGLFAKFLYLLSHAAVAADPGSRWHAYRFFGDANNRLFAASDINTAAIEAPHQYADRVTAWLKKEDIAPEDVRTRVYYHRTLIRRTTHKDGSITEDAVPVDDLTNLKFGPVYDGILDYPALQRRLPHDDPTIETKKVKIDPPRRGPPPEPPPGPLVPAAVTISGPNRQGSPRSITIFWNDRPDDVCPTCRGTPHLIIPEDMCRLPGDIANKGYFDNGEFVPPKKWWDVLASEVHYADPRFDYMCGVPYLSDGHDDMFLSTGVPRVNPAYARQPDSVRGLQCDAIIRSVSRYAVITYNQKCRDSGKMSTSYGRLEARRAAYADLDSLRHPYTDEPLLPPDAQLVCSDIRDLIPADLLTPGITHDGTDGFVRRDAAALKKRLDAELRRVERAAVAPAGPDHAWGLNTCNTRTCL